MGAPRNRNNNGTLQDPGLRAAKLAAGVVSVLVLGLFVTSLFRAPEPAWTVVLAVTACGLAVLIIVGVSGWRRR